MPAHERTHLRDGVLDCVPLDTDALHDALAFGREQEVLCRVFDHGAGSSGRETRRSFEKVDEPS
jgi:hypothetical protein